jgi:hypothetical protein
MTPVAIFAYNRPDHLSQTVAALAENAEAPDTPLYVFSDAPALHADHQAVADVRKIASDIHGFGSLEVIERRENYGLARNIMEGVSHLTEAYGRIIVLEDDLVVSPFFLRFMNEALKTYENEHQVASIHGYVYPTGQKLPEMFFLRGADCWGWGTWKRAWKHFEADGNRLLADLRQRGLERTFDFDGTFPYTRMLYRQTIGKNKSWAVRWYASAFLAGMYTLYPGRSLVRNIGHDHSGTHSRGQAHFDVPLASSPIKVERIEVEQHPEAFRAFKRFFRSINPRMTLIGRLARRLKR